MDVLHNGTPLPDPTPTGGPSTNLLKLNDGGGITFSVSRQSGQVSVTPAVTPTALPGGEVGYDQITAGVNITGTSLASANTIIAGSVHTFDGSPVVAEFSSPEIVLPSVAGGVVEVVLFEGGASIAAVWIAENNAASSLILPAFNCFRFTPSAGSHTYSIKAFATSLTGTPAVFGGNGSGGNPAPAYLRFTKV